jgi:hypothetical protein
VLQPRSASAEPKNPAVAIELEDGGRIQEALLVASQPGGLPFAGDRGLVFERRGSEAKAYRSAVTITEGGRQVSGLVSVNQPLSIAGWTLYQANYDPKDLTYSGLEAVRDPGVAWVFGGFALITFGVAYMLNIAPRIRRERGGARV